MLFDHQRVCCTMMFSTRSPQSEHVSEYTIDVKLFQYYKRIWCTIVCLFCFSVPLNKTNNVSTFKRQIQPNLFHTNMYLLSWRRVRLLSLRHMFGTRRRHVVW